MSQNSCCIPGCLVTEEDGIPLHRFPNPDVNAEKFNTWIAKIGGEVAMVDKFAVHSNRCVCHNFQEIDGYPGNRLCILAIPELYLPEQLTQQHTESVSLPFLPSTSGIQKIQSDIHMRECLHAESATLPALPSTSGVQKTPSDLNFRILKE